jgi:hypothetical protein
MNCLKEKKMNLDMKEVVIIYSWQVFFHSFASNLKGLYYERTPLTKTIGNTRGGGHGTRQFVDHAEPLAGFFFFTVKTSLESFVLYFATAHAHGMN